MSSKNYLFTSESVTEGHPDKMCDQISDALVDAILAKETRLEKEGYVAPNGRPACLKDVRCAIETFTTTGTIVVMGEVRTQAYVDVQKIVRDTVRGIGYDRAKYGFDADTCGVINMIHEQSPDIAQGVDGTYARSDDADDIDKIGAGDQGMMFGYASDETDVLMPMPIYLAQRMAQQLAHVRKNGTLHYLRPDGKTQVTVRYEDDKPVEVTAVVVSTQHAADVKLTEIREDMIEKVIAPVLNEQGIKWDDAKIYVNPTGRFVVGGPMGDTGLTGDRSAAYAARWVAKNVVAAGLAHKCEVELAYAIGVPQPLSVMVDTQGTGSVDDEVLAKAVQKVFDLRPGAIIRDLDLRRPIYQKTAAYGHFGRKDPDFTWEQTNRVDELKAAVAELA